MITRKAIVAAFETITADKGIKTVVAFCSDRPAVSTFKMQTVRVTRHGNGHHNSNRFHVRLGYMTYRERKYVEQQISKTLRTPKMQIIRMKGK